MNISKLFNAWIASNFKGLSALTLGQFIRMEYPGISENEVQNMIYVDLYQVFTKKCTDKERKIYAICKDIVESCAWL